MNEQEEKPKRGFALLDPELRRERAVKGGKSVPPEKRSFSLSKDLASRAGRLGGFRSRGGGRNKSLTPKEQK